MTTSALHIETQPYSQQLNSCPSPFHDFKSREIIASVRSTAGDHGVYFLVFTDKNTPNMVAPFEQAVLKHSENLESELVLNKLARRLNFVVPDMRILSNEETSAIKANECFQDSIIKANVKINKREEELTGQGPAITREALELDTVNQFLLMDFINASDLTLENPIEPFISDKQADAFLHQLTDLFFFDVFTRNYDRFAFVGSQNKSLFPEIEPENLWGNLGNIMIGKEHQNLMVIDSISTHPADEIEAYFEAICQLVGNIQPSGVEGKSIAMMLKIDGIMEHGCFKNTQYAQHSLEDWSTTLKGFLVKSLTDYTNILTRENKLRLLMAEDLAPMELSQPAKEKANQTLDLFFNGVRYVANHQSA